MVEARGHDVSFDRFRLPWDYAVLERTLDVQRPGVVDRQGRETVPDQPESLFDIYAVAYGKSIQRHGTGPPQRAKQSA